MNVPSKTEALRQLTNAEALPEHQSEFDIQITSKQDDRGACLLIVAQIDIELEKAIEHKLGRLSRDVRAELYERDGPLATFARKITMAVALGIVAVSRENLRIIRHVRNAFAHAKRPIKFSTPEVKAICMDLTHIKVIATDTQRTVLEGSNPRSAFEAVCACLMMRLASYADIKLQIDIGDLKETVLSGPLP
jgi:hypothetical protein